MAATRSFLAAAPLTMAAHPPFPSSPAASSARIRGSPPSSVLVELPSAPLAGSNLLFTLPSTENQRGGGGGGGPARGGCGRGGPRRGGGAEVGADNRRRPPPPRRRRASRFASACRAPSPPTARRRGALPGPAGRRATRGAPSPCLPVALRLRGAKNSDPAR
ncbi:hypothetical protein PVAP13_2NG571240 [Panicum virgatum]|uniref:Uncharacterized protein n=1 Tax=Panicum virgatum TaxID=38727 RepID=A0A8T0VY64_PANVG|nr:hypothetical protein PVAP13_2NG571240 [Panicum virgatum]